MAPYNIPRFAGEKVFFKLKPLPSDSAQTLRNIIPEAGQNPMRDRGVDGSAEAHILGEALTQLTYGKKQIPVEKGVDKIPAVYEEIDDGEDAIMLSSAIAAYIVLENPWLYKIKRFAEVFKPYLSYLPDEKNPEYHADEGEAGEEGEVVNFPGNETASGASERSSESGAEASADAVTNPTTSLGS